MKTEAPKPRTADLGFECILMPLEKRTCKIPPYYNLAPRRLYIHECFSVTLDGVAIGACDVMPETPVSTLFYSVPTNEKTVDRIRELMRSTKTYEPDANALVFAWDEVTSPDTALGLPISWKNVGVGNLISLKFSNHSLDPVRVFGVLRCDLYDQF